MDPQDDPNNWFTNPPNVTVEQAYPPQRLPEAEGNVTGIDANVVANMLLVDIFGRPVTPPPPPPSAFPAWVVYAGIGIGLLVLVKAKRRRRRSRS